MNFFFLNIIIYTHQFTVFISYVFPPQSSNIIWCIKGSITSELTSSVCKNIEAIWSRATAMPWFLHCQDHVRGFRRECPPRTADHRSTPGPPPTWSAAVSSIPQHPSNCLGAFQIYIICTVCLSICLSVNMSVREGRRKRENSPWFFTGDG